MGWASYKMATMYGGLWTLVKGLSLLQDGYYVRRTMDLDLWVVPPTRWLLCIDLCSCFFVSYKMVAM